MIRLGILLALAQSIAAEPALFEKERKQIRQTLHVPESRPELEAESHGRFEPEPGVIAERVSYRTLHGMRVPAILYMPAKPKGRVPALVVVNGHGGDKYSWYAFYTGILYARAGAAVLTYDPIGEGERNSQRRSGTRAHDTIQKPDEIALHLAGLMQSDVMQAVSYLSQRREVDPQRIAAVGYSMGSFVLSIACAQETRLKACVLVGGGNLDGPGGYWDSSKPMCQGLPYKALQFLGDRPARIYAMHAARGATLIYNGEEDTVVLPKNGDPKMLFRTLQQGGAKFETMWEPAAGHRPYFVTKPAARWLETNIDLPNWTQQSIETMSETQIAEWAEKHSVDMDKLYATEHREGGTRALGVNVPALTREMLSVFADPQWESRKAELIYESWLERVRGTVGR
jgi:dipeptidyl aminopeptidase/acylaminoacyl peptidase